MPTVVITGANRGIGLQFVRDYAAAGWRVHAACRKPEAAAELKAVPGVAVHKLDVTSKGDIVGLAKELAGQPIDVLINNAGVYGPRGLKIGGLDYEAWDEVMRVNALAPVAIAEKLMPNLMKGGKKLVVAVTSQMGSIGRNAAGNEYVYRSSKAALNMAMKCLANEAAKDGLTVIMFHPGHVKTDMGGPNAPIDTRTSVAGMRGVIETATPSDSGKFFNYDGAEIPW
jgi:NAD(P)-dependent dehydrogenase (short-subunit alcohol dehydrogenase family)